MNLKLLHDSNLRFFCSLENLFICCDTNLFKAASWFGCYWWWESKLPLWKQSHLSLISSLDKNKKWRLNKPLYILSELYANYQNYQIIEFYFYCKKRWFFEQTSWETFHNCLWKEVILNLELMLKSKLKTRLIVGGLWKACFNGIAQKEKFKVLIWHQYGTNIKTSALNYTLNSYW